MKFAKKTFKPLVIFYALVGLALIAAARYAILKLSISSQYKQLGKLSAAKNRLYRLIFNPYRIPNGIRPAVMPLDMGPYASYYNVAQRASYARSAS